MVKGDVIHGDRNVAAATCQSSNWRHIKNGRAAVMPLRNKNEIVVVAAAMPTG